jgi:hypothetical protein
VDCLYFLRKRTDFIRAFYADAVVLSHFRHTVPRKQPTMFLLRAIAWLVMPGPISVFEAVEWREPAPGGGSQAQVFRLSDGRFAIVKFPENPQGEHVLASEFLSCQLAETLDLPINRALMVSIDERLLRLPRQNGQIPPAFSAGIRCGMVRFEQAQGAQAAQISTDCQNSAELHSVVVFDQLVCQMNGGQFLIYPAPDGGKKRFAAHDYGHAFGGQPAWSAATLGGMPPATLPPTDPLSGQAYPDGAKLLPVIDNLRMLTAALIHNVLMKLEPPRWAVTPTDVQALGPVLLARAQALVQQFDERYPKQQLEAKL